MDERLKHLNQTVERLRQEFAGDPNVHSIGIGLRYKGGELQDEVCIRFLVHHKYQSAREIEAAGTRPIPDKVDGFPTDVEALQLRRQASATGNRDSTAFDPLIGGVATSNADEHVWLFNSWGTLGVLCRDASGNAMALSNWHVWADGGDKGDDIIQPAHPSAGQHLEGIVKVGACLPIVSSLIEGDLPSPLTASLYGGAAAAAVAAAALDYRDPTRRGQDATPTNPGERTLSERVDMAIEYPDLPWPGTPFRTEVKWKYTRRTDARELTHSVGEQQQNAQFLIGRYLTIDKAKYKPGESVKLVAAIWDYQPRPCDSYHAVAHLIPLADSNRVLRAVLRPAACPRDVPLDPPNPGGPGQEVCIDFGEYKPGQSYPPEHQFKWLGVLNLARDQLRIVDWYPIPADGRGELYLPRAGLQFRHPPASAIHAEIVHYNQPVKLTAFDAMGNVVGSVTTPGGQGTPHPLRLQGPMIVAARLEGGGSEAVLLRYCIVPVGGEEMHVVVPEGLAKVLAREKVLPNLAEDRRVRVQRCCFVGEITLPPTEPPGAWNAFLTVQNINATAEGTPPPVAATVIGGHVLTSSAQVAACAVVMLADHVFDII